MLFRQDCRGRKVIAVAETKQFAGISAYTLRGGIRYMAEEAREAMGVFIDFVLRAEGTSEEVAGRLERVRQRCLDLPLRAVGPIQRVDSIYTPITIGLFLEQGYTLPEAVAQRYEAAEADPKHGQRCLSFALLPGSKLPESEQRRYLAPALELIKTTDLWNKADLPEEVSMGTPGGFTTFSVSRRGVELEFANILLRYGYMLILDPGEGSETMSLALSTYQQPDSSASQPPLWYGQSFTKTQYAKEFIRVHETLCRVLDIVQEEGLLLSASDTCGYYASRTWEEAGERVNDELSFARAVGDAFDLGIGNLREEGVQIQTVVNNASKAQPVDFSSVLKPPSEAAKEDAAGDNES
jgi:hypothetical protein